MKLFLKKFIRKFYYAFMGLQHGICCDKSIRLQLLIGCFVLCLSAIVGLQLGEWLLVLAMILLVLAVEFINSCIEHIADELFPMYSERAKIIKDYAAAAVLLISLLAAMIGIYIIGGNMV